MAGAARQASDAVANRAVRMRDVMDNVPSVGEPKTGSCRSTSEAIGQPQCADEHRALDEILRGVGHVQHGEPVQEHTDENGADDGAEDVRPARGEHREADQGGCDRIEEERSARGHIPASHPRRDDDAARCGERRR